MAFMTLTLVVSCTDDDIRDIENFVSSDRVIGFPSNMVSMPYFEDEGAVERRIPVNVLGGGDGAPIDQDVTVHYEIVAESSTAVEGVEFDFVDNSRSFVIPEGSGFGEIPILVNTGNFNPTEKTQVTLRLTTVDAEGFTVGQQYRTVNVVFVGCQSTLAGNYTVTIVSNVGTFVRTNEVITEIDVNTFRTLYLGGWAPTTFNPPGFTFVDICGEISLPPNQTLGGFSNAVQGISSDGIDGEVLTEDSFRIVYEVRPYPGEDNMVFTATYVRNQ